MPSPLIYAASLKPSFRFGFKHLNAVIFSVIAVVSFLMLLWPLVAMVQCALGVSQFICDFSYDDGVPMLVALGYLISGLIIYKYKKSLIEALFFLWGSITISTGMVSSSNNYLGKFIFVIFLIGYTPVTLHFFLKLLGRPLARSQKIIFVVASILAVGMMVTLWDVVYLLKLPLLILKASSIAKIFFGFDLVYIIFLFINDYQRFSSLAARRRIRMLAVAIPLAFLPLITLTIIPQVLNISAVISAITMPWLLLIPVMHMFSSFRNQLGLAETMFREFILDYILATLYTCIFLMASQINTFIPGYDLHGSSIIFTTVALTIVFIPLRNRLYGWIKWMFYGNETDYQAALDYLESSLSSVLEKDKMSSLMLEELFSAIKPAEGILFLRLGDCLSFSGSTGMDKAAFEQNSFRHDGVLGMFLINSAAPLRHRDVLIAIRRMHCLPAKGSCLSLSMRTSGSRSFLIISCKA